MGPVVTALAAIGKFIIGATAAAGLPAATLAIIGGAFVASATIAIWAYSNIKMPKMDTDASRQSTVKSTTESRKIIYGEALVSGPLSFVSVAGSNNKDLYQAIALAGHEVESITDIYFDNEKILNSQIASGLNTGQDSSTLGRVTAGTFGPKNSQPICVINKHLGTATQAADPMLLFKFGNYTAAHQGKGVAYIATKFTFDEDSSETWDKYSPQNIKALVKGKKVYDPRLDTSAGANPTNSSYIAYSDNPALCLADYLLDSDSGMGILPAKIDWAAIVVAANGCDVSVAIPNSATEKRFTCNGVIFTTDSHRDNINKILSSMNGNIVYSNGKYVVSAGIFEAPSGDLTETDLISGLSINTSIQRSERFNTVKGLFIDPGQAHKSTEFPPVQLADAVSRDNGEVLEREVQLPMTNSSFMAQRISNKMIQLSDQQKVVTFPANLSALRIMVGDRVRVSIEELGWTQKVFQCMAWTFSEEGGVSLTLREDSSTSYADPAAGDYSTITADGSITEGSRGIASPSGLSATAKEQRNELNWVNPADPSEYNTIFVWASANGNYEDAKKIGETTGTQFFHDSSNSADSVTTGALRFYWVQAVKYNKAPVVAGSFVVGTTYTILNIGSTNFTAIGASANTVGVKFTATGVGSGTGTATDDSSVSNLEPNANPNTTVSATVGRFLWSDVAGSTGAPTNNATAGAQISVDLFDADGTTVMSQADVKNSILAQEILEVEVEAGEVLSLETGQDVDIQNLGDVAIYVSDSNATLNTSINTVANNLSALEVVLTDLTSGVSEVFVQATAPVAGVGGIPDPIPDFSRWYDSSANNQPYYWDGSAWQDLRDGQTTQNAAAITNLQTSLTTTNSNVTTNASAVSVLDATSVTQGNSITSITSDVTALETTVNDATTGVAATSTALGNLTTRVTSAEGSITTNSSDIVTLNSELTTAEGNITTNATAVSALDTRVTTAEGTIVTQSSDITALQNVVDNPSAGIIANADAITALTTRVTDTEGATTVNSGAVTTLNATYTEDLHFRTQAEDENDDLIDLETSGTVELQDLTDFVAGSSAAIDSLTVQTFANENGIQTQAIQLTALESTVNDPANGVVATAGALSTLSSSVSVIDGQVTSTAQDLTTLTTTVGSNTSSITTQSNSINGVEANYSVKIDNNNRITGFGLLSTTSGSTPFSEFAVVADQFSIVSPDSTADTPIQPFTVTADKIYFGTDVIVSGDLISTGTISADRLQIDGVMFDTETVGNVTSLIIKASGVNTSQIAESAITTARLSNDAVTVDKFANTLQSTNYVSDTAGWQILTSGDVEFQNAKVTGEINATSGTLSSSIAIGTGDSIFKADSNGIYLGNATFASAPFRVSQAGALTASSATLTGNVTASSFTLSQGATLTDSDGAIANTQQLMAQVTGIIDANQHAIPSFWRITTDDTSAPSNAEFNTAAARLPKINDIVITTDTTTTPDTTYGWTCTVAGTASTEATWTAITNFISGDLLVDGSVSADQINANSVASAVITAGSIIVENDLTDTTTIISGGNILTGTILADYIDVSGVITAGALITDSATIANDIRIGSGESVFSADSNGIYLGNETFGSAEFRVTPAGALTATSATLTGSLTADSLDVTNITGAVTGFDAGKISGEVTEVYPLTEEPAITLNNDNPPSETVLLSFSTPAPENSVSKRNRISLGLEFSAVKSGGSGVNLYSITYWVERKSIGFEAASLGNVTFVESLFGGYVEKYTISGNVTLNLDSNGAVAPNTNPTAAQIGRVAGVSYDSVSDKTKLTLEFGTTGSQRYSNNTQIYFSPSQFTASGVYSEPSGKNRQTLVIKDSSTSSITVPMTQSFGATTAARDYRIYSKPDIQYVGVVIKCNRINGSIENIA